jgi:hypothetical protein
MDTAASTDPEALVAPAPGGSLSPRLLGSAGAIA